MIKMGFTIQWVYWIMLYVETVDYSMLVNRVYGGPIILSRGLREDNPFSPYIFIG
jgi:hypothetical protein